MNSNINYKKTQAIGKLLMNHQEKLKLNMKSINCYQNKRRMKLLEFNKLKHLIVKLKWIRLIWKGAQLFKMEIQIKMEQLFKMVPLFKME